MTLAVASIIVRGEFPLCDSSRGLVRVSKGRRKRGDGFSLASAQEIGPVVCHARECERESGLARASTWILEG
jgi:hypothetical protein